MEMPPLLVRCKCEVIPPTDIYPPVSLARATAVDGGEERVFHLNPMAGVWASVLPNKAIGRGYYIDILAGYEYTRMKGLAKP